MHTDSQDPIATLHLPVVRLEASEDLRHAWHVARDEALLAYRDWCAAEEDCREGAYFAYVAAADREQAATLHLQRSVEAGSGYTRRPAG
jgi:hypothetical protein